jgi:phosphoglycolate phosphatase-like HAD superfamily hydrolase
MNDSVVYALDFDGVICDSALETGISGWKAARQIWPDMPQEVPPNKIDQFRQIRPIIETGYEAVLAMRMLHSGADIETIYNGYKPAFEHLMEEAGVDAEDLKNLFGQTRDEWIAKNQQEWIEKNPLYPNVPERLAQISEINDWYIVTTKQERFVKMILRAYRIDLHEDRIFGLDRQMSKAEVLKKLLSRHPKQTIHFFEDRIQTLQKIQLEPELKGVQLHFALWGYNTVEDKRLAAALGFTQCSQESFLVTRDFK